MRIRATQWNRNLSETRSGLPGHSTGPFSNRTVTSALYFAAFTCALAIMASHCASAQQEPAHPKITESQLNVTFIQPGITTRTEVLERLAWADAGVREDRLFVARWVSSSADAGAAVDEEVPAAVRRTWRAHNLLVGFDRQGVVIQDSMTSSSPSQRADVRAGAPPTEFVVSAPVS